MKLENCKTSRGHQEPFSIQFAIFIPNKVGKLLELFNTLSENKISVAGFSIVNSTDWQVIRAIFYDPNKAREVLNRCGYGVSEANILLLEVADQDEFFKACEHLLNAEISIEYAFSLADRNEGNCIIALRVEDYLLATHLLIRHDFTLLGSEDLKDPH